MRLSLVAGLVMVLVALAPARAHAGVKRYAMVVAYSGADRKDLTPLEYADDDGARYYELLGQIADVVRIYTVLDADTQQIHPVVAKVARTPKRSDVLSGLDEMFEQIKRDTDAGHETVFYFVLVGHGIVAEGGEGTVALLDGAFSRTDMFQKLLARSPATTNHIIVDACNAYYMVHRRGPGDHAPRTDAVHAFMAREDLSKYPNTGVLLSTSSEKDTHEWSAYRAGVFSHELRSAMAGAADINGDGQIAYSEIAAFLAAANQHVTAQARLEVFAQAPAADLARPLVDLQAAKFTHWLTVPAGSPLRFYLEDQRGVRYLDAHVGGKQAVVLGLAPSAFYYVRSSDGATELKLELGRKANVVFDRSRMKPSALASRGAVEQSFRLHLYEEPFGADYYRGYVAAQDAPSVALDAPRWRPGPPDRELVDSELHRLNARAREDAQLRERLNGRAIDLVRAIDAGTYDRAEQMLREIETPR